MGPTIGMADLQAGLAEVAELDYPDSLLEGQIGQADFSLLNTGTGTWLPGAGRLHG